MKIAKPIPLKRRRKRKDIGHRGITIAGSLYGDSEQQPGPKEENEGIKKAFSAFLQTDYGRPGTTDYEQFKRELDQQNLSPNERENEIRKWCEANSR